ncbi:hypothetical protein HRJ34_18380 [Rhizorhabdus wittichii]|jgi:hypothetical protein|uniref:Uncharacterized protein n=1 Tax=Rhizorhabdus wittichii TaxID=160791 RepID=A0A975D073_9SPHN|nr:DUF6118 family protein [Rhizorhabdus wittichii]QTH20299.1 hypothetical protein HRJ34_18380 [Rhizorhabdus wittichii]
MADDEINPARAFEDLRAEVSVLRKAVEAMPEAISKNKPPSYAEDLGVIGKGLDEIAGQLEEIMKSPALRLSPQEQGAALARGGQDMMREAADSLKRAAQSADSERSQLSYLIGTVRSKQQRWRELGWTAGVALAIGLVASPFIASWLPFGLNSRVSALVMMRNRWEAGQALMAAGNPSGWAQLAADANLARNNRETIGKCREAADRAKKDQRCTITVRPDSRG